MPTDRDKLLDGRRAPAYGAATPDELLSAQRETLRRQDHALGTLSAGVGSVRTMASLIHSEVASQNVELDALAAHTAAATRAITDASGKTAALARSTFNARMFCILLWPLVLLIVLLVEAVAHFIF